MGTREFSAGLTFVACSCVCRLQDLLFDPPFPFQRVANLASSQCLQERQQIQSFYYWTAALCNKIVLFLAVNLPLPALRLHHLFPPLPALRLRHLFPPLPISHWTSFSRPLLIHTFNVSHHHSLTPSYVDSNTP